LLAFRQLDWRSLFSKLITTQYDENTKNTDSLVPHLVLDLWLGLRALYRFDHRGPSAGRSVARCHLAGPHPIALSSDPDFASDERQRKTGYLIPALGTPPCWDERRTNKGIGLSFAIRDVRASSLTAPLILRIVSAWLRLNAFFSGC
jgi:hypothetical protein